MNRLIILILSISFICSCGHSKNYEDPKQLVTSFFKKEISNYKSVLKGEAKKQGFNPKKIPDGATFEIIQMTNLNNKAAFSVEINDQKGNIQDIYVFLNIINAKWKITAFRSLWLPPLFYYTLKDYKNVKDSDVIQEYEKRFLEAKQNNDTITKSYYKKINGSKDNFVFSILNSRLVIKSDKDLIKHFNNNKLNFNELKSKIEFNNDRILRSKTKHKKDFDQLLINRISKAKSILFFSIGGMIDNEVGYLFCPKEDDLPEITDRRYIMIKKIGNGWYLYKTT